MKHPCPVCTNFGDKNIPCHYPQCEHFKFFERDMFQLKKCCVTCRYYKQPGITPCDEQACIPNGNKLWKMRRE